MTICLNMIVKNEVRILERCLASVAPWIDRYAIADTGSTDGTQELIRSFFERRETPGVITQIPFEDFGQARNAALEVGRASGADHLLLVDADMELVVDDPSFRERLSAPAYRVRQDDGTSYDNVRIVRRNLPARYIGRTHEYLDTCGVDPVRLEGAWFLDHAEGSNRTDKFERDLRLLRKTIEEDPSDARTMFYLGQTYRDLERFHEAVYWYDRRATSGGWEEEAWFAAYRAAECRGRSGDDGGFVAGMLAAFERRPTRAEPLHALAHHYRVKGEHETASIFIERGAAIGKPPDDRLFVEDFVYDVGFRWERSIVGFYLPGREKAAARDAMDLAVDPTVPEYVRDATRKNAIYYAESLVDTLNLTVIELDVPRLDRFSPLNPTIATDGDGNLQAIVRLGNWTIRAGDYYRCTDPDGIFRTENVWLPLAPDLTWSRSRIIRDLAADRRFPVFIRGYEDLRLFQWRESWWATATVLDRNADQRAEIALLHLCDDGDVIEVHVQRSYDPNIHQKNWVPLVRNEELFFIYTADPTIVLRVGPDMQAREVSRSIPRTSLDHLRGGTQAIQIAPNRWLYIAHEAYDREGETRQYLHRFITLDGDLRIDRVSDPFYFMFEGIEFAAGMTRTGDDLVIAFGVDDRQAYLTRVSIDKVLHLLR